MSQSLEQQKMELGSCEEKTLTDSQQTTFDFNKLEAFAETLNYYNHKSSVNDNWKIYYFKNNDATSGVHILIYEESGEYGFYVIGDNHTQLVDSVVINSNIISRRTVINIAKDFLKSASKKVTTINK